MTTTAKAVSPVERFMRRVDKQPDGCWNWTAHVDPAGYGHTGSGLAHRAAYELLVRPIPDGLTLDHLCRNRRCVNPAHLEAVTMRENARRGSKAQQTHCVNDHEFTPENTYFDGRGCRSCKKCRRAADAARRADPANRERVREQARRAAATYRAKKKAAAS